MGEHDGDADKFAAPAGKGDEEHQKGNPKPLFRHGKSGGQQQSAPDDGGHDGGGEPGVPADIGAAGAGDDIEAHGDVLDGAAADLIQAEAVEFGLQAHGGDHEQERHEAVDEREQRIFGGEKQVKGVLWQHQQHRADQQHQSEQQADDIFGGEIDEIDGTSLAVFTGQYFAGIAVHGVGLLDVN